MAPRGKLSRIWSFEPTRLAKVVEETEESLQSKKALQQSTDRRNQAWTSLVQSDAKTTESMHQILMEVGIVDEDEDMEDHDPFMEESNSPRTPKTPKSPGADENRGGDEDDILKSIDDEFGINDVDGEYVSPYGDKLRGTKDNAAQARARHMIVGHFDDGSSNHEEVKGSLFAFLAKKVVDDPLDAKLSKRVAKKWGWFMLAILHLRMADCAEQQLFEEVDMSAFKWPKKKKKKEESIHIEGVAAEAIEGELEGGHPCNDGDEDDEEDDDDDDIEFGATIDTSSTEPFLKPARRATLFGSSVGVYREITIEGTVNITHCLTDGILDVSQSMRIKKSKTAHRIHPEPLLYFDDIRPDEPRKLPVVSQDAKEVGGILLALQVAEEKREKEKAAQVKLKKLEEAQEKRSSVRRDSTNSDSDTVSSTSTTAGAKRRNSVMAKRLALAASGKLGRPKKGQNLGNLSVSTHSELLREEQRFNKLAEALDRVHETTEYWLPRRDDIFEILRRQYDPEGLAHCTNHFYSPQNLLRREALRFEPQIQFLLRTIWRATDADDSGAIDKIEYIELHSCLTCALIGRAAGDSMMRLFLCKEDWDADRKGFKTLNRQRLEDCFFTLADRFTAGTDVREYVAFLNRLLSRIVEHDPETGEVKLRKEEEILAVGDKDPLLYNSTFQFFPPEEIKKRKKKGLDPNNPLVRNTQATLRRAASSRLDRASSPSRQSDDDSISASQAANKAIFGGMGEDATGTDQAKVFKDGFRSYGGIDIVERDRLKKEEEDAKKHRPKFHIRDRHQVIFDFIPEKGSYDQMSVRKGMSLILIPDLAESEPPDDEGWVYAEHVTKRQVRRGWVPLSYLLMMREKRYDPIEYDDDSEEEEEKPAIEVYIPESQERTERRVKLPKGRRQTMKLGSGNMFFTPGEDVERDESLWSKSGYRATSPARSGQIHPFLDHPNKLPQVTSPLKLPLDDHPAYKQVGLLGPVPTNMPRLVALARYPRYAEGLGSLLDDVHFSAPMNIPWSPGHGSPKKLEERLVEWLEQDSRPKSLSGVPHVELKRSDVTRNRYLPSIGKELLKQGLSRSQGTPSISTKGTLSSMANTSISSANSITSSTTRSMRSSREVHPDPSFQELLDLQMGRC